MKLKELTAKQLVELRKKQYEKQEGKCAILGIEIDYKDAVMDHKHKTKVQECGGPEGLGCCRGVIHRNVNTFEGKLERVWKRYALSDAISLPELLRRCADYIDNPPMQAEYIHPTERQKREKLSKNDYKRIIKYYFKMFPNRKKIPKYPISGLMTAKWKDMLNKANEMHNTR